MAPIRHYQMPMELPFADIEPERILENLIRLGAAFLLTLPMAWDRERSDQNLGLRTFPLVAVASCAFLMLGKDLADADANAQTRVLQGVITGIGFLGGGAIVKQGLTVRGTATAAAIWNTAAIGAAVAHNRYEIAILLGAVGFGVLHWLKHGRD